MARSLPIDALLIYLQKKYIKERYTMECMWLQATGLVADKDKFKRYDEITNPKREINKKAMNKTPQKTGDEIIDDLICKLKSTI